MKKSYLALAAGAAACALSPVMAQEAAAPAAAPATRSHDTPRHGHGQPAAPTPEQVAAAAAEAQARAAAQAASPNTLLAGTEVHMVTRQELSSRTNHLGDRFDLEVTDDVVVNGRVVIPARSVATGEITRVRKKGGWGRSGILETRLISVRVGDRQIRLHGAAGDRGRAGTAAVVGAVLLSPLIVAPFVGFFVTGTSAVVPAMTTTVGYTEEDVPVLVETAEATPAPAPAAAAAPEGAAAPQATPQAAPQG